MGERDKVDGKAVIYCKTCLTPYAPRGRKRLSGYKFGRRVDILLKGDSTSDDTDEGKDHIWVEVKSILGEKNCADVFKKSLWSQWNLNASKYSYHRQFYLDRVANSSVDGLSDFKQSVDFQWWLQDFKKRTRKGYDDAQMNKAARELKLLPSSGGEKAWVSLGYNTGNGNNSYSRRDVREVFKLGNVKNLVIDHAKDFLFHDVDEELVQKLFDEVELD